MISGKARRFVLPTHCYDCGALLMGNWTRHGPKCFMQPLIAFAQGTMTRDQKLRYHLEETVFSDLPEGATANAAKIEELLQEATPEQKDRAYARALTHNPVLLEDER